MTRAVNEVAIVGAYASPIIKRRSEPIRKLFAEAALGALEDAGLEPKAIDGLVTTPPGINPDIVIMYGAFLGKYLGLDTRLLQVIENGGATAALSLRAAVNEVALGRVKRCLVVAADERHRMDRSDFKAALRFGAMSNIGLNGAYDGIYAGGFPVPIYAMSGQRYLHEYDVSLQDCAEVVVQLRKHAVKHPGAQFRETTTVAEVLDSPVQSPPVTLYMCCPVSTGAAGVVVDRRRGQEIRQALRPHRGNGRLSRGGAFPRRVARARLHHLPFRDRGIQASVRRCGRRSR